MKSIITLITAPLLFVSCAGSTPSTENVKDETKVTQPTKVVTTRTPAKLPPLNVKSPTVADQPNQWQDSPRMFDDLDGALDPATDRELNTDVKPIGAVPNNIITPPSSN